MNRNPDSGTIADVQGLLLTTTTILRYGITGKLADGEMGAADNTVRSNPRFGEVLKTLGLERWSMPEAFRPDAATRE